MNGMRVSIAEAAGKPNKASTWQGGKMKKVLAIVAIAVLAMLLAPARTTTVHVVRYIPAGGTVWGAGLPAHSGSLSYDSLLDACDMFITRNKKRARPGGNLDRQEKLYKEETHGNQV